MRRALPMVLAVLAGSACKRAETVGAPAADVVPAAPADAPTVEAASVGPGPGLAATEGDPREELTNRTYDVLLDGTIAYRATTAGVVVEDLSQPETPRRLAVAVLPGSVNRLALLGDVPRPPAPGCSAPADGGAGDACSDGPPRRVLAAAAGPLGVVLFDVHDPARPVELSRFDTPGAAMGLAASYPDLYVADGTNGVLALDVRDPERPRAAAAADGPSTDRAASDASAPPYVRDVLLDGTRLFAAAGPAGLLLYEVRSPSGAGGGPSLTLRAVIDTPGDARAVAVDGATAYVADGAAGLQIVDTSSAGPKAVPGIAATWATRDICRDVKVAVGRDRTLFPPTAYLALGDRGLEVLEITDAQAPKVRGRHEAPRPVNRVTLGPNGLVLLANDSAGLRVLDVADPAAIRVVFPRP